MKGPQTVGAEQKQQQQRNSGHGGETSCTSSLATALNYLDKTEFSKIKKKKKKEFSTCKQGVSKNFASRWLSGALQAPVFRLPSSPRRWSDPRGSHTAAQLPLSMCRDNAPPHRPPCHDGSQ